MVVGHGAGQEQNRQQETGKQQYRKYSFFHHKTGPDPTEQAFSFAENSVSL